MILDHPALEEAIQAQDFDSIRRLFLSERELRIRIELHRDGLLNGIVVNARSAAKEPHNSELQNYEEPRGGHRRTSQSNGRTTKSTSPNSSTSTSLVKKTSLSMEDLGF